VRLKWDRIDLHGDGCAPSSYAADAGPIRLSVFPRFRSRPNEWWLWVNGITPEYLALTATSAEGAMAEAERWLRDWLRAGLAALGEG
jgi:hypothetical protein